MSIRWQAEACDLAPDPVSGAAITRLTSAAMHSTNLYFEQPYGTPDSSRVAFGRAQHTDPRLPPTQLWVANMERLRVALIDTDIVNTWFATSSWTGLIHYLRSNGELIRVDLATLEKEIVVTHWPLPLHYTLWSVTPDLRYLIVGHRDEHSVLQRIDLQTQEVATLYESEDILGHVQIHHVNGRDVLVQRNIAGQGATHFIIDLFDGTTRSLKIGLPHTASSTGHASWIGDTGRMGTPVQWNGMRVDFRTPDAFPGHDDRHPKGNLILIGPDDEGPQVFEAPEHLFNHSSMSRCGRYFVAESLLHGIPGAVEIVVGNLESGKYRTVVSDCGSSGGGPACSHVHAYFTADTRHVIYNADPTGLCQLHRATLPSDFLDSLD